MKSPDVTKKGLECCSISYADCNNECPYKRDCDGSQILKDALALIQQLEAELEDMTARYKIADDCAKKKGEMNEKLYAELATVKAERDAAVQDLEDYATLKCFACKYYEMELTEAPCDECKIMEKGKSDMFEWRGVQKQ